MVKIADRTINGTVRAVESDCLSFVELFVPNSVPLTDEDMIAIRDANKIEELAMNYGEVSETRAVYGLFGWVSIVKNMESIVFRWQSYRATDVDQLRQDNEDLTEALLELAAIVGGGENG